MIWKICSRDSEAKPLSYAVDGVAYNRTFPIIPSRGFEQRLKTEGL